jgi:hemerythrin-like domain-containing protein
MTHRVATPGLHAGPTRAYLSGMTTLHDTLYGDHARLEGLLQELQDAVEGADQPTLQAAWARFESGLMAHMDMEERHILPAISEAFPNVVAQIRDEHAHIRRLVSDLGVTTEIHWLRKETADALIEALRDHASYEDRTLYMHAERALSQDEQASARRFLEEEGQRRYGEWEARWA